VVWTGHLGTLPHWCGGDFV